MKHIPTVHELRKQGWKVRVTHERQYFRFCPRSGRRLTKFTLSKGFGYYEDMQHWWALSPKGGRTAVTIKPPVDSIYPVEYTGEVHCSLIDSYVRKYGVKRAMAIAYSNYLKANEPNEAAK